MAFKVPAIAEKAKGGSELVSQALIKHFEENNRHDLLDFFDFYPSRVDDFDENRPAVYILHDLPGDPCFEHFWLDKGRRFALMVFVSDWQHQQFMKDYRLQGHNCAVIPNGIHPFPQDILKKWDKPDIGSQSNPLRLIYHTTPHRGLEILIPVYQELYKRLQDVNIHTHLDVYSSFNIYGWPDRDEPFKPLFETIRNSPGMAYHGSVSNNHVRKALEQAHVFAFPSIWPETFCLAIAEAMSAGVVAVHSNYGALPQTTGGYSVMYPHLPDMNQHAHRFFETLYDTILTIVNNRSAISLLPSLSAQRTNLLYEWNSVIPQWFSALDAVKTQLTTAV